MSLALIESTSITPVIAAASAPHQGVASTVALLLAVVFAVAAVLKFMAPSATRTEFGALLNVPKDSALQPAIAVLARVIPILEVLVAVALVIRPQIGAVAAAILLGAFTAVIVATVRSGRSVSCGCLGSASRQPVSMVTVARNFVLLAMAIGSSTVDSVIVPDIASVLITGSLLLSAAVGLQLLAVQKTLGRIWSVELAGEADRGPILDLTKDLNLSSNTKGSAS